MHIALRKFDSIYIGWGMKSTNYKYGFSPTTVPMAQAEYPSGPEITEALDPTLEEEQALKAALEEQRAAQEEAEGLEDEEEDDWGGEELYTDDIKTTIQCWSLF